MKHWIMYVIIALVIIGAITHPAGSTSLLTVGEKGVMGESALLSGQGVAGGSKGTVNGSTFA